MCFTLRLHTSAAPPRGGLTQALALMKGISLTLATISLLAISSEALAQRFPDHPIGYYRQSVPVAKNSNCNTPIYDSVAIKRKTSTLAYVAIDTLKCDFDADRCQYYGIGRWRDNKIIASAPGSDGKICRITLNANGSTIKVVSIGEDCNSNDFCGWGGSLGAFGVFQRFR